MQIGDPNQTVTGVHTYVISYRIRGVFNTFPDHDELNFNVTGNGWEVPIAKVEAAVGAPVAPTQTDLLRRAAQLAAPLRLAHDRRRHGALHPERTSAPGRASPSSWRTRGTRWTPRRSSRRCRPIGSAFRPTGRVGRPRVGPAPARRCRRRAAVVAQRPRPTVPGSAVDAAFATSGSDETGPADRAARATRSSSCRPTTSGPATWARCGTRRRTPSTSSA